jgi:hypothetical protein
MPKAWHYASFVVRETDSVREPKDEVPANRRPQSATIKPTAKKHGAVSECVVLVPNKDMPVTTPASPLPVDPRFC